jgi:hypothetical protein
MRDPLIKRYHVCITYAAVSRSVSVPDVRTLEMHFLVSRSPRAPRAPRPRDREAPPAARGDG